MIDNSDNIVMRKTYRRIDLLNDRLIVILKIVGPRLKRSKQNAIVVLELLIVSTIKQKLQKCFQK